MCLHFSSVKQAGLTAVFKSQKHEVNARQAVRCSGGVEPETTVVHGTVSPVDSVHGENLDEFLPDTQGRQPQLKLTRPACGRPPVRGEGNADVVSSRPLRLYPRRPAEQMADQSLWPAGQGLASEGPLHFYPSRSLFASGSQNALARHSCRAQHHISQLPSLAGKKQLLKTSRNNHTACY